MQLNIQRFQIIPVDSIEKLGRSILSRNYGNRRSFLLSRYYFLAGPDCSRSEYAVCLDEGQSDIKQIESIDFTFLSLDEAIDEISLVLRGRYDFYSIQTIDRRQLIILDRSTQCCLCHSLGFPSR